MTLSTSCMMRWIFKLLNDFKVMSSRTMIILYHGDDSDIKKYISKFNIIINLIWDFSWAS